MPNAKILLVEDDPSVSRVVTAALTAEGHIVDCAGSVKARDEALSSGRYDLLVTDVGLGGDDGLGTLDAVRSIDAELPVIVISAQNTLDTAVRATETGAFEYFPKPFDIEDFVLAVAQALRPRAAMTSEAIDDDQMPLVGRSPAMQDVYRMIARLLKNDLSVLVLGESGTGKELVAEAIHQLGHRKSGPFVAINMAAIPTELIEAELFGYEKGAFTGAVKSTAGKFEQAAGGTLFLDEIGDMPMPAQTRLLRALQSGEIVKVGGKEPIKLDVRIISATNQDFPELIADGKFREDLYYRINVVPIDLPPLRARSSDIPALANHFLRLAVAEGLPAKTFTKDAMQMLEQHSWRGNVRELKNTIYRLAVVARDDVLPVEALQDILEPDETNLENGISGVDYGDSTKALVADLMRSGDAESSLYTRALAAFEKPMIEYIMGKAGGNQIKAAKLLGINRNTLRKKLTEYDINPSSRR